MKYSSIYGRISKIGGRFGGEMSSNEKSSHDHDEGKHLNVSNLPATLFTRVISLWLSSVRHVFDICNVFRYVLAEIKLSRLLVYLHI